nr:type I 3-dehydroquinate dehydratase [uncultured Sellimonas sp.]
MHKIKVRNVEIGEGVPKICVPILEKTEEKIEKFAQKAVENCADLAEWRVDGFSEWKDQDKVKQILAKLRKILGEIPLLFTFRTKEEGGESEITPAQYVLLNQIAITSGKIDLVDVEFFMEEEVRTKLLETADRYGVKTVFSSHDFKKTPSGQELLERLHAMEEEGADIAKIAVMPKKKEDVIRLLNVTWEARKMKIPVITMSMGKLGSVSRVCGELFGSCITFGTAGKESAPGQIESAALKQILQILSK